MADWSLTFLLLALLAAVFGFTGPAFALAGVVKLLFLVFMILFVVSLVTARDTQDKLT